MCPLGLRWHRMNRADNPVLSRPARSAWDSWVELDLVIESPFPYCNFVVVDLFEIAG